ncbi:hypothetical protein BaRGS_00019856 [Batillaria attramentaria]|uniref:Uncharacterized protein n=1 Tax=Batillaria attramentaria TaxID=370345 RepID=A0ABD0KP77_9CAEN
MSNREKAMGMDRALTSKARAVLVRESHYRDSFGDSAADGALTSCVGRGRGISFHRTAVSDGHDLG